MHLVLAGENPGEGFETGIPIRAWIRPL
jgi:hypothetical protein